MGEYRIGTYHRAAMNGEVPSNKLTDGRPQTAACSSTARRSADLAWTVRDKLGA